MSILYTLSDTLKQAVEDVQETIFDVFKKTNSITVYKVANEVVITNDGNFDANFGPDAELVNQITRTGQSSTFQVRVFASPIHIQDQNNTITDRRNLNIQSESDRGRLILQTKIDGYNFMRDGQIFYVEGVKYNRVGSWRPLGIIDFYVYEVSLEETN